MQVYRVIRYTILLQVLLFNFANAQIFINEVMFNPEGSDSGREWIELCSGAQSAISLSTLKLEENGTKHKTTIKQGTFSLEPNKCAIIANDDTKFLQDYPAYSGQLFDSSFYLSNSGEKIAIYLNDILQDELDYTGVSVQEGNSISRDGQSFKESYPSPGELQANFANAYAENADGNTNQSTDTSTNTRINNITELPVYKFKLVEIEPPQDIFIREIPERTVHKYENFEIPIELFDARGRAVDDAEIEVSFGDLSQTQRKQAHESKNFKHFYKHTGSYTILIKAKKGALKDTKKVKINVIEPKLEFCVDLSNRAVRVKNNSKADINLESWFALNGTRRFKIPFFEIPAGAFSLLSLDKAFSFINRGKDFAIEYPDKTIFKKQLPLCKESLAQSTQLATDSSESKQKSENLQANTVSVIANENSAQNKSQQVVQTQHKESVKQKDVSSVKNTHYTNTQNTILGMQVPNAMRNIKGSEVEFKNDKAAAGLEAPNASKPATAKQNTHTNSAPQQSASVSNALNINYSWAFLAAFLLSVSLFATVLYYKLRDPFDDWTFEE